MRNILKYTGLFILLLILSCKKNIEIELPANQLVSEAVFNDSADATSAIVGIYTRIMQLSTTVNLASGGITIYTGLASDELNTTSLNSEILNFSTNAISPENSIVREKWRFAYELIYQANACIEGLTTSNNLKASVKNQLLGEAKFVRAFLYFYLINIFGDVPLVTTIDYKLNSTKARNEISSCYTQILNDLKDAELLLTINYVTPGKLRPNRLACNALLARVYLYQKDWLNAEKEADKVINSGIYNLEADLNNVFLKNSSESILQMPPLQSLLGTAECRQFVPLASAIPTYFITNTLLSVFDISDQRRSKWMNLRLINGQSYTIPFKYKLRTTSTADEHYVFLRYAEQFLIRSEARLNLNNYTGAINDLNIIRRRSGLVDFSSTNNIELDSAILKERQRELFCEWGHRWFDLKRVGKSNAVLSAIKPTWNETDILFPIPFLELQNNPFLVQNTGY